MIKKAGIGVLVALVAFLGYVSTRPSHFKYERSGVINAPAAKIFPYISNLKMGALWSPYEKKDPNAKKTLSGNEGQVGSMLEFDGNQEMGSGKIEVTKVVANQEVEMKLTMTKPFHAENMIQYILTPEGAGTKFTWAMSGDGGFLGKLIGVFIDCEKMVTTDFVAGINNLKELVESQK
jgi:uncharacterized protein YndB with AHSA1/START domain